jgi:hypothetical protein
LHWATHKFAPSIGYIHSYFVSLSVMTDWEIYGCSRLLTMYLHIFQERLGCISYGCQEGALQTARKGFQSTYSEIQTCCNVVQSNCGDSGLGGHLGRSLMGLEICRYLSCMPMGILVQVISIPHITHMSCDVCVSL